MTENSSSWKNLYPIFTWAAILLLAYSLATMVSLITFGGMPETAQAGFDLLVENRLVGLLRLDVLTILVMPLYYLILLGLYGALKTVDGAKSLLAAFLQFVGVTLVLATPSAFSFLTLGEKFAAATDKTQKTLLPAVGVALMMVAGPLNLLWFLLLERDFFKLRRLRWTRHLKSLRWMPKT